MRTQKEIREAAIMAAMMVGIFKEREDEERLPTAAAALDLASWVAGMDSAFEEKVIQPMREKKQIVEVVAEAMKQWEKNGCKDQDALLEMVTAAAKKTTKPDKGKLGAFMVMVAKTENPIVWKNEN